MTFRTRFAEHMVSDEGIVSLMDDLAQALTVNPDILFLGGGNPAHIPEFERFIAEHLRRIVDDDDALHTLLGVYQGPRGDEECLEVLVSYFQGLGWPITRDNIALTHGSQSAFFILLNLLAGSDGKGQRKKICLPMLPEYMGYADQGIDGDIFCGVQPRIETFTDATFKYHVDFDQLALQKNIAALCVSRPTNPSANVLSDNELERLGDYADGKGIPFIIDAAYGDPFPGIVYEPITRCWQPNRIFIMSLSKIGSL